MTPLQDVTWWRGHGELSSFLMTRTSDPPQAGTWAADNATTPFMLYLDNQKGHIQEKKYSSKTFLTIAVVANPPGSIAMAMCAQNNYCILVLY